MADARTDAARRTVVVVGVALAVSLAVALVLPGLLGRGLDGRPLLALLVRLKLLVSTFTAVVLVALLATYVGIYRDVPTRFTLSLVVFALALLCYALASNPVVWVVFGVRAPGIGPFTVVPDLFAALAVVVLLAQSGE